MRYDLRLRIRRVSTKKYIYNKAKKNVSIWYLARTLFSWFRFDNTSYHYVLTITRHKK